MASGMNLTFALASEGTSEQGLIPHLAQLMVEAGATSATGTYVPTRGKLIGKLETIKSFAPEFDLVFIHRDSDSRDANPRRSEIEAAGRSVDLSDKLICVVPVQELEAWLLTDESEIRAVAGKPRGRVRLTLPAVASIERTASPKEILTAAIMDASETTGRARSRLSAACGHRIATLLDRLDTQGEVRKLASFARLISDIEVAVERIAAQRDQVSES